MKMEGLIGPTLSIASVATVGNDMFTVNEHGWQKFCVKTNQKHLTIHRQTQTNRQW